MIRLILLLLAGLAVGFYLFGKDLSDEEKLRYAPPETPEVSGEPARVEDPDTRVAEPVPEATVPDPVVTDPPAVAETTLTPVQPVPAETLEEAVAEAVAEEEAAETGAETTAEELPAPPVDPAALPPAQIDPQTWYVSGTTVNVRSGQGTGFDIVGAIALGEAVTILSDPDAEWVQVRVDALGIEGFVASRFLSPVEPDQ